MTLKEILRHIRDVHRHFTTPVRCGINDCPSITTTYNSLRQHLYKKHRSDFVVVPSADCDPTMPYDVVATSMTAAFIDDAAVSRDDACSHGNNTFVSASVLDMA